MKIVVFDTETTGLPPTRAFDPADVDRWPHIVQFSFVIMDLHDGLPNLVNFGDAVLRVPLEKWSEEAAAIHGISLERMKQAGIPTYAALSAFIDAIQDVELIVGHNVQFDLNMVRAEIVRLMRAPPPNAKCRKDALYFHRWLHHLNNLTTYCTAENTVNLCRVVGIGRGGAPFLKFPKLVELHQTLFQTTPNHLHNSFVDSLITLRCYVMLAKEVDLLGCCRRYKLLCDKCEVSFHQMGSNNDNETF